VEWVGDGVVWVGGLRGGVSQGRARLDVGRGWEVLNWEIANHPGAKHPGAPHPGIPLKHRAQPPL
jgi:hypothetical protein